MTTLCLRDDVLLGVRLGEATPDDTRHAAGCPLCTRRLAKLAADLARIDGHLRTLPPAATRRARRVPWMPVALAAAAAMALVLVRPATQTPAPVRTADADVSGFFDDVASAFHEGVAMEGVETAGDDTETAAATDVASAPVDFALGARSTCGVDEPFIGVGCEDTSVQLAALER